MLTVSEGVALMVFSCIVSLAVFAVNSKINAASLKNMLDVKDLELRIEQEYIKPAMATLMAMVQHVEEQLKLRDQMAIGFDALHAAIGKRRETDKG